MNEKAQTPEHNFFRFTTTRPVAITMIVLGILVFGWLSYNQLSLDLMPDITYPSLTVRTEYPGAAPEEVESAISRPVEEALGVVADLVSISSISKAGQSDVILEYNWDADMNEAISEVREKLDLVFLPLDAEKPLILKYDPSLDPIIRFGLTGGGDLFYTRYVAEEEIKRALETVEGVAAVKVKGGYEEEIRVELNEKKISLMGMDIQQIRERLGQENVNLAGGELKEGQTEYIVRTLNEFRNIDEIADIRLGMQNRREIRLSDIGRVFRTNKERQLITSLDNKESVELEVYKEGDANIVEVAKNVREKVMGSLAQQAYVRQMAEKAQKEREARKAAAENKDETADASEDEEKEEKKELSDLEKAQKFQQEMLRRVMTNFIANKLPDGMEITLLTDQSRFIVNSIDEVKNTAIMGGILAVIVLFLFLSDLSITAIVGIAIPISIIATFTPMKLFDVSLNIMSLGGLALGIGMLVDNSIVVIESIFRCREEGDDFVTSVIRGTGEVGSAVAASTLTTIAVFFPMVFVQGIAGQIFGDLALTVVFSLLASLGVALFLIPMLASRHFDVPSLTQNIKKDSPLDYFFDFKSIKDLIARFKRFGVRWKETTGRNKILLALGTPFWFLYTVLVLIVFIMLEIFGKGVTIFMMMIGGLIWLTKTFLWEKFLGRIARFIVNVFNTVFDKVTGVYPSIIRWALDNKIGVLALSVLPFIFCVMILLPQLGSELIPEVHQSEFNVELTLPIGTPVESTTDIIHPIEEELLAFPEVKLISTVAGVDLTKVSDTESGEHTARVTVVMETSDDPIATEVRLLNEVRAKLQEFSGISYKISKPVLFSFKTPIEVEIKGYNLAELTKVSRDAVESLSRVPGLTDVKSNLQRGHPEVQIVYDRVRLNQYGLNIMNVANIVRNKVRGDVATQFKKEDRRIDILVRVRDEDKSTIDRLKRLNISPTSQVPILLESVADIQINEGPSEIRRIDQERSALILANISGRSLSGVSGDVYQAMQAVSMPGDFTFEITGQNKEMEVSLNSLQLALLLAIFMVYIVMASQFESFVYPLVILFTVPFALIGVVLVLWVGGIPMNIMVFLGLIMLAGIVVNNAIVLVDYINQLRRRGLDLKDAIEQAGKARLRPILMTTLTTVLGLLPMALGLGEGAEIRTPMAITVIAGLISATILTLVVIPTVYALFTRAEESPEAA